MAQRLRFWVRWTRARTSALTAAGVRLSSPSFSRFSQVQVLRRDLRDDGPEAIALGEQPLEGRVGLRLALAAGRLTQGLLRGLAGLLPPGVELARADPMAATELGDLHARLLGFLENAELLLRGQTPALAGLRHSLPPGWAQSVAHSAPGIGRHSFISPADCLDSGGAVQYRPRHPRRGDPGKEHHRRHQAGRGGGTPRVN
jgi:hypothetical protein